MVLLACCGLPRALEVIDRIVATVNGQPILQSEWEVEMRYEALLDQRPLPSTLEAAQAVLDRLIDQELLRQQIKVYRLGTIGDAEIRERLQNIRRQIPGAGTEAEWRAMLARYGLTQDEVNDRVATQLLILHFIDVRVRPTVHVDRRSIETYYREKLLPELRLRHAKEVPLADVTGRIEEVLSQQRTDSILSDWLHDLRQQSEIHVQTPVVAPLPVPLAQQVTP
jgi:hypothetical protein